MAVGLRDYVVNRQFAQVLVAVGQYANLAVHRQNLLCAQDSLVQQRFDDRANFLRQISR